MPSVLIRDVPEADLADLKAAAADRNVSLQTYLLEAVHGQAIQAIRQAELKEMADRFQGVTTPGSRAPGRRHQDTRPRQRLTRPTIWTERRAAQRAVGRQYAGSAPR